MIISFDSKVLHLESKLNTTHIIILLSRRGTVPHQRLNTPTHHKSVTWLPSHCYLLTSIPYIWGGWKICINKCHPTSPTWHKRMIHKLTNLLHLVDLKWVFIKRLVDSGSAFSSVQPTASPCLSVCQSCLFLAPWPRDSKSKRNPLIQGLPSLLWIGKEAVPTRSEIASPQYRSSPHPLVLKGYLGSAVAAVPHPVWGHWFALPPAFCLLPCLLVVAPQP